MTCEDARRLIARAANGERDAVLAAHLASCEGCRLALDEQARVAAWLGSRPAEDVSPSFAARVRARLDSEADAGILDLANWRVWGGTLAPLAAGLTLAAWLGVGLSSETGVPAEGETLASWAQPIDDSRASVFLHPDASADLLIESLLTGVVPPATGEPDVR